MKRKQIYSIVVGIILTVFAVYTKAHEMKSPKQQVTPAVATATSIQIDKSIRPQEGVPIKVAKIVDGDTLVLANGEEMRYIGIDTPEEFDKRKPVQCYAVEAAQRNKELVEGHTITFYKDVNKFDKYGRWLGYVYLEDGTFLNLELVNEGYAFAYPFKPDTSKAELFASAEKYARDHKLGLWGNCQTYTLTSGREQTDAVGPTKQ